MINLSNNFGEASPITAAPSAPPSSHQPVDDGAPPPRWGLLAVAIVAAMVTASWVADDWSAANAGLVQSQSQSALAQAK